MQSAVGEESEAGRAGGGSILDRVRHRPRNIFTPRSPSRRPFSSNRAEASECAELRAENAILKQLLEQQQQLKQLVESVARQDASSAQEKLSAAVRAGLDRAAPQVQSAQSVESSKGSVTLVETTSYPSLVTSQVTKDISLRFNGQWKTTQLLDTVVEVSY